MASTADLTIGRNLARMRAERGLGRAELAHRLNMAEAALAGFEAGEARMPPELFFDLAHIMDVPISAFFASGDIAGTSRVPMTHPIIH